MKKFLSLVLALVMTMSLVTVSAGAKDFTDSSKITYKEAVDVISALDIVDGYTDGAFNPTNTLTRGAAAKIICNLILGPTTAEALRADTAPFKDVPTSNNFAGYITYCAQKGIISGYTDGTFRPGNTLTGYAFMKMLLGALGYDAANEGYSAPNWQVAVGKQALGIGLNDGNANFVGTNAVTREEACLYAFNTLQATMVEYGSKTTVEVNGATVNVGGADYTEVKESGYKSYDKGDDDTLQFCEKYFSDLKKDAGNDDFGRPANTWKIKSTEIGTYANTSDLVETYTKKVSKGALYTAVGKTVVDDLKDNDATLEYWFDGAETVVKAADVEDFMDKNNTAKINAGNDTGNGSLTEVYVDDDNNVTVVVINTYVFQATSDYSSSNNNVKIAAAGDTEITLDSYTLDGDDFDIKDITEDEYLLITASKMSDSSKKYEVQSVAVAEMVTGEVTSFSVEDDVTIDGTTYEYAVVTKAGGVQSEVQSTGGQTALVLDAYGYVIAVDDTAIGGNYVFVSKFEYTNSLETSVSGYAYFADGTDGEITLKKVAGETSKSAMKASDPGWYTYSKDSSNKYTLTKVSGSYEDVVDSKDETNNTATTLLTNGKAKLETVKGASNIKANEKTVFVIVDQDGDVDVYTGVSNAPDISVTKGAYTIGYVYRTSNGNYASYVFVSVEDNADATVDASTDNDTYIFLTKLDSTKNDGTDTYYVYKAIVDGVETKIETDSTYTTMQLYTKIKTSTSTERITGMSELAVGKTDASYAKLTVTNAAVNFSNGVLSIGDDTFIVNSDSQLNLVLDYKQGTNNADKDVLAMMADSGAKYEANGKIGGSTMKSTLSGYTVSGYVYIVTEDDYNSGNGNTTLDYLFLYVDAAEKSNQTTADDATITTHPASANYVVGDTAAALTVAATGTGTLSYQWYKDSVADANKVGTNSPSYTPDVSVAGTTTYFCVVTNTDKNYDKASTVQSNAATITVADAPEATMNVTVRNYLLNAGGNILLDEKTVEITTTTEFTADNYDDYTVSGSATKSVTFAAGSTATVSFLYAPKAVTKIEVTNDPDKMDYTTGDVTLALAGVEITATYDNGTTAVVTDGCTFSPDEGATVSDSNKTITVTHTASGKTATISLNWT